MTSRAAYSLEVDGEQFEVTADPEQPGLQHVTWTTAPHPPYGFSTRRSDGRLSSRAELSRSIRDFLADIDPESGYL